MMGGVVELEVGDRLEVRDLERREIAGRVIPYGEEITVRGKRESFRRGALAAIKPGGVRLLAYHDPHKPIGRMVELEEREDGAYAAFRVSRTALGNELLELAGDGVLAFSAGFVPGDQTAEGTHTRLEALPEVSLVAFGAYPGAEVLTVRDKGGEMTETNSGELEVAAADPIDLGPLERRMETISERLERIAARVEAPAPGAQAPAPTPLEWFTAEVSALSGKFAKREALAEKWAGYQTRALADVEGTLGGTADASGLIFEEFLGAQLVNVLDTRRPLFSRMGRFPMPRSGYARIPVVTQSTLVGPRALGQKTAANSRKLIVTQTSFEAEWFDGAVDVALELVAMSEPSVVDMVWNDLLGQYAIATEAGIAEKLEDAGTGFTYTGAVLPTTDYPAFAKAVAEKAIVVRKNSGAPATKLAVTEAQWPLLVAMVDANDRRQGAARGPTNADFAVTFTDESFELPGGIEVFWAPGITKAILFNQESLRAADGGPERVQALNVELMGQDLGVLGRVMFVPRIPAGVVVFGTAPTS